MIIKETVVTSKSGLHARPASDFVKLSSKFKSAITLNFKNKEINAKSIIAILSAGITCGSDISIKAEGADEEEAVEKLVELIKSDFGE
jgi:phosphocarrier protein HPr